MLAFLLGLLKIIGIILLIILLVVLILVTIVLLVPIKYYGEGILTDEKKQVRAKITWLFKLIRVKLDYSFPEKPLISVKILCFELMKAKDKTQKKEKKSKEPKKPKKEKAQKEKRRKKEKYHPAVNSALLDAAEAEKKEKEVKEAGNVNRPKDMAEAQQAIKEQQEPEETENKIEKIIFKIQGLYDKINHIIDNINCYLDILEEKDTQELLKDAWSSILKILESIKPKKLRLNALIGFDSPDTTGRVFGYYCMLMPWLSDNICVDADFEQKIINGDFYLKGKITILTIVVNGLRIVLDKRLKPLIKKIKNGGKNNE